MKWILMDIEGTTSKISFVKEVLFPYAHKNMHKVFLLPEAREILQSLKNEYKVEKEAALSLLRSWIEEDKKEKHLKSLQGLLWQIGYETGELKAHVYSDVPRNFKKWTEENHLKLAIYSSGSVKAQKLLFKHSVLGDLTPYLSAYFDLEVGPKYEKESYVRILEKLECEAKDVIFLSDMPKELMAAKKIGIKSYQLLREDLQKEFEPAIENFDELGLL